MVSKKVTIEKNGQRIQVSAGALKSYISQGWWVVKPPVKARKPRKPTLKAKAKTKADG